MTAVDAPRSDPVPLIELRQVSKIYGSGVAEVRALDGVDLQIQEGEFVAVMGPSGSGKSTAMNILGCLDTPTQGSYRFRGVPVESLDRNQRALLRRHYLGFVFQGFNLLSRTSALENVELPLIYRRIPRAERHRLAREALAMVGLTGWEHHSPAELSGGQQQRVAIARALAMQPQIMFFDEPTSALDPEMIGEVLDVMRTMAKEGMTMIVVSHEMGFIREAADRILFMADGLIVEEGTPEEIFKNAQHARTLDFLSKIL